MPRRLLFALVALGLALTAPGVCAADPTAAPTVAATATAPPPIPLAEVAAKSDEVGVFLRQLDERLVSGPAIDAIVAGLPAVSQQIADRTTATQRALANNPGLREVDTLSNGWRALRDQVNDWTVTVTGRVNELEQEIAGLDGLRDIWRATREAAKAESAPPELIERTDTALGALQSARKGIEARRKQLLVLQDRLVEALAATRDPMTALSNYRRDTRLLVATVPPLWVGLATLPSWSAAIAHVVDSVAAEWRDGAQYVRDQGARLVLPFLLMLAVGLVLRRANARAPRWLADDPSLARAARIFESPTAGALLVGLVATRWALTAAPPILDEVLRLLALLPALYILRRLLDPPLVPALWGLVLLYGSDRACRLLAPEPLLEQVAFLVEMLSAAAFLAWLTRSGRFRAVWPAASRWGALADRAARLLIGLFVLAGLAGAFGFMQLARYLQEALLDSSGIAVIAFGILQVLEGLWAFLLRTRLLRRLHMVEHHRTLLQRRGERFLGWVAFVMWAGTSLINARLFEGLAGVVTTVLRARVSFGALTLSLGDLVAFAITVWASFLLSRFLRFVLAEDVFPRVTMTRGVPYALSNLIHYSILFLGFMLALAAMGVSLDRFALLAGAFGVGIGFGLQNIVNNFVSGLILLFERPVQVGDSVQLANVSGEVRHIGIRSSTLRTGEGADVIVPNGEFISGTVVNWTLTDRNRRIDVPIVVAHGTDPEQMLALLRAVAGAHPYVLEQPKPGAFFLGSTPAGLSFELQAWTDHFGQSGATRSELAIAIHQKLAEADIPLLPAPGPAAPPLLEQPLRVQLMKE
ncbi:MAG: mechanosensitive ion channel [Deltaproteobacteria bacterium]|nr:mechanosensitive ion channel [Deltaproteobacteria bacterium]